jgi:hypothetical protein
MVSKVAKKNTHRMTSCAYCPGCGNGENEKKTTMMNVALVVMVLDSTTQEKN